ncbi:DUF1707 domain-containing protein [Streptomyces gossypiisoli]|uniref:DUF1707 domain-containing protein n=1 Tax=Streptomyces gossypiisoli TaxID=2748864 RepID=UPI0038CDB9CC
MDERVGAALSARTMGDLAALTGDLPFATEAKDVVRIEQQGGRAGRGRPKRRCDRGFGADACRWSLMCGTGVHR